MKVRDLNIKVLETSTRLEIVVSGCHDWWNVWSGSWLWKKSLQSRFFVRPLVAPSEKSSRGSWPVLSRHELLHSNYIWGNGCPVGTPAAAIAPLNGDDGQAAVTSKRWTLLVWRVGGQVLHNNVVFHNNTTVCMKTDSSIRRKRWGQK